MGGFIWLGIGHDCLVLPLPLKGISGLLRHHRWARWLWMPHQLVARDM
jgi:hypothetical protein